MVLSKGRCVYLPAWTWLLGNKQEDQVIGVLCSTQVAAKEEGRMGALFSQTPFIEMLNMTVLLILVKNNLTQERKRGNNI